jgi:hypothetical protein
VCILHLVSGNKLPGRSLLSPIKLGFFLISATICFWGGISVFFKQSVKIGDVIESGFIANLCYGKIGGQ